MIKVNKGSIFKNLIKFKTAIINIVLQSVTKKYDCNNLQHRIGSRVANVQILCSDGIEENKREM